MMKKYVLYFSLFLAVSNSFASSHHHQLNPSLDIKKTTYPGYCEIQVENRTTNHLYVRGVYKTNLEVKFNIPPFDTPHYINLSYDGKCHSTMFLEFYENGYRVFSRHVTVNGIYVWPYV